MASRQLFISAESILALLAHYTEGDVPLGARLLNAGVSSYLGRWIGLEVEASDWRQAPDIQGREGLLPLHVRYEGKRVATWESQGTPMEWGPAGEVEAPRKTS